MMKVLQMLLKSPGGKKAAAALYRTMKKGKGLAQSTKQGIKRDLRPGYKELMGSRGRKPAATEDILKMYERLGRKVSPSRASMDKSVAEMSKFLKPRHPGTPTGVKVKDAIPGVKTYKDLRAVERTYTPNAMRSPNMDALSRSKYAKSMRDRAIAMDLRGMAAKQRGDMPSSLNLRTGEMKRSPQVEELYNKIAKIALPAQKATRRKPKSLYGKTKKAMRPAYKKMMKLRKRLQEKGLI